MEENPKPKTLRGGRRRRRMVTTWSDTLGDLIPEILSRLPVKSVLRFRCVSKSWYALISDPNFIDMHLRNRTSANNNGYVLVKHESVNFYGDMFWLYHEEIFIKHKRLELPFNRSYGHFEVVGYCNGILCLSSDGITYNMGDIYLWNPSIQKFKALPPSLKLCSTLVHMFYTFSFVPQINDYKVIKFVYDTYDKIPRRGCIVKLPPKVEVYSLRLNSWKEIQNVVPCVILYNSIYTFVNGVVHWVATMNMEENCNYEFILTFDMVTDVFGEMKLPECCRDVCVVDKAPTVLNKSLCLFVFSRKGENEQVDIWVMKEYGATESWTKQFTFDQWVHFLSPLGFMKNGEVVLLGDDEELVSYDPRVEQVEKLRIYGVPRLLDVFTYYTESLVLLNERN